MIKKLSLILILVYLAGCIDDGKQDLIVINKDINGQGIMGPSCDNNVDCTTNTNHDANFHQNIGIDGNVFFKDINNTTIGTPINYAKEIYSNYFACRPQTNGKCIVIPGTAYIFEVLGSAGTGLDFNGVGRYAAFASAFTEYFRWGMSGASVGLAWQRPLTSTSPSWAGGAGNQKVVATTFMRDFQDPLKGVQLMIDSNGKGTFSQVGSNQVGDFNVLGVSTFTGDTNTLGNARFDQNINVKVDADINGSIYVDFNAKIGKDINSLGRVWMSGLGSSAAALVVLGLDSNNQLVQAVSDAFYKTNIQPLNVSVDTNRLYQVQFHSYNDATTGQPGWGVIAQELEPIFPQAVINMPNGHKAVDYKVLSVFEMAELQKKNQEIGLLKAQNDLLRHIVCDPQPFNLLCQQLNQISQQQG